MKKKTRNYRISVSCIDRKQSLSIKKSKKLIFLGLENDSYRIYSSLNTFILVSEKLITSFGVSSRKKN